MSRKYGVRLTPQLESEIIAFVRAGAYPHVAAQAAGVPKEVFDNWMGCGIKHPSKSKKTKFRLKVEQAMAQARTVAEIEAFKSDPMGWLKSGPGKEVQGSPGWAAPPKPVARETHQTVNIFGSPELLGLLHTIRALLAPYPDALAAVTESLKGGGTPALPGKDVLLEGAKDTA